MTPKAASGRPKAARPVAELSRALGAELTEELATLAVTHRSYAYEHGGLPTNERLEFLGDAVLGLVVTDRLFTAHPDLPEGQLAKFRAAVVNMRALAGIARGLGLGEFLLLGRGEETTGGRDKDSILADTTEAVIGAVYLQHGIEVSRELVRRLVDPLLERSIELGAGLDWKTSLQELCSARGRGAPEYRISESGPDHDKRFAASALVDGEALGAGNGRSKKEAEQQAAQAAWRALSES